MNEYKPFFKASISYINKLLRHIFVYYLSLFPRGAIFTLKA
jgi:hypothetical protein